MTDENFEAVLSRLVHLGVREEDLRCAGVPVSPGSNSNALTQTLEPAGTSCRPPTATHHPRNPQIDDLARYFSDNQRGRRLTRLASLHQSAPSSVTAKVAPSSGGGGADEGSDFGDFEMPTPGTEPASTTEEKGGETGAAVHERERERELESARPARD